MLSDFESWNSPQVCPDAIKIGFIVVSAQPYSSQCCVLFMFPGFAIPWWDLKLVRIDWVIVTCVEAPWMISKLKILNYKSGKTCSATQTVLCLGLPNGCWCCLKFAKADIQYLSLQEFRCIGSFYVHEYFSLIVSPPLILSLIVYCLSTSTGSTDL